jgi:hypothetical protein
MKGVVRFELSQIERYRSEFGGDWLTEPEENEIQFFSRTTGSNGIVTVNTHKRIWQFDSLIGYSAESQ